MTSFTIVFVISLFIAVILTEIQSHQTGIVPAPTWKTSIRMMLSLLPENPSGNIVELGSGWGGSLIALAEKYPEHRIIGYELAYLPFLVSFIRIKILGYKNVTLYRENFMDKSLTDSGVLFCYLSYKHMANMEVKLLNELKTGTVLVSHSFPFPHINPVKEITFREGFWHSTVFKYAF